MIATCMMYKEKYIELLEIYTKFNIDMLNITDIEYKNLWNYIVIKWNYCLNIMNTKNIKSKNEYTLINSIIYDLTEEKLYENLLNFIQRENEINIMKIKFTAACISKYL